jgi:CBS domain-containing protein
MKVQDIMLTDIVTIQPETSYEEAANLMREKGVSAVPVVDATGKLVGLLSEKDLFRALYPDYGEYFEHPDAYHQEEDRQARVNDVRKEPLEKFMKTALHTVKPEMHLLLAGGIMLSKGVHQLPVLEEERLVGIVTREELFETILKNELGY